MSSVARRAGVELLTRDASRTGAPPVSLSTVDSSRTVPDDSSRTKLVSLCSMAPPHSRTKRDLAIKRGAGCAHPKLFRLAELDGYVRVAVWSDHPCGRHVVVGTHDVGVVLGTALVARRDSAGIPPTSLVRRREPPPGALI